MSAADLNVPGFYGKMPAAGDFVTRRLPLDFVQAWDRCLAKSLAPLIGTPGWDDRIALRFLSGDRAFGAATGVIVSSGDRVGRRFPLTIVALVGEASLAHVRADAWFSHLETLAFTARAGEFNPDELDGALLDLPVPPVETGSEIIDGMIAWTDQSDLNDIDPDAPLPVLERLLAMSWETS